MKASIHHHLGISVKVAHMGRALPLKPVNGGEKFKVIYVLRTRVENRGHNMPVLDISR